MKRRAISMLGALAVATVGFLFAAPQAHAQTTTVTDCALLQQSYAGNLVVDIPLGTPCDINTCKKQQ